MDHGAAIRSVHLREFAPPPQHHWVGESSVSVAPPPPQTTVPFTASPVDPPVWSPARAPALTEVSIGASTDEQQSQADRRTLQRRLARRAGTGLSVALGAFFALQLISAVIAWQDAEIRIPGQGDAIVGYAVCCALLAPAFLLRGRWRVLPTVVASFAGAALPVLLAEDLFAMLGIRDVWIGQSFTLHVMFPLVVGGLAVLSQLVAGRRRVNPY